LKGLIFILTQKQLESIIFENTILSIEGISLVGLILLIFVYWKRAEKSPFSKGYIFYTFLMICYVSSHMLKHVNEVFGINEIFFSYIKIISFVLAQFTWIILCWTFSINRKQFDRRILLIYIFPAFFTIMLLTNPWHGLMGTTRLKANDIGFYESQFCITLYFLFFIAMIPLFITIFKNIFRLRSYLFKQALVIVCTGALPLIAYLYISIKGNFISITDFDGIPVISAIMTIIIGIIAIKYRVLNLIPIVFKEFVEYINSPFVLLDNNYTVLYNNKAFTNTFSIDMTSSKDSSLDMFLENLSKKVTSKEALDNLKLLIYSDKLSSSQLELFIVSPETKYYDVSLQTILDSGNEALGKMIFFNDITVYKNLASIESELAATKARYEISRDAHDIIGNAMTHIILYLREELFGLSKEELASRTNVVNALTIAEQKVDEFRKHLYQKNTSTEIKTGVEALNYRDAFLSDLSEMKNSIPESVNLTIAIDENLNITQKKLLSDLKMICLEGINNSLKHGLPESIDILVKQYNNNLVLNIIDDGSGCKNLKIGFGLEGISKRVHALGGTIKFISDEGFRILVKIPLI